MSPRKRIAEIVREYRARVARERALKRWPDVVIGTDNEVADRIVKLFGEPVALQETLERFRERVRVLENRIEFAALPIGTCSHCLVGNRPGSHHLPDCPLYAIGGESDE